MPGEGMFDHAIRVYSEMAPCREDGPGRICYCDRCVAILASREVRRLRAELETLRKGFAESIEARTR